MCPTLFFSLAQRCCFLSLPFRVKPLEAAIKEVQSLHEIGKTMRSEIDTLVALGERADGKASASTCPETTPPTSQRTGQEKL